jgi:hypothetical protein
MGGETSHREKENLSFTKEVVFLVFMLQNFLQIPKLTLITCFRLVFYYSTVSRIRTSSFILHFLFHNTDIYGLTDDKATIYVNGNKSKQ